MRHRVVPHSGALRARDLNTDAGTLNEVGGNRIALRDLDEDRRRHIDEVRGQNTGVQDALVKPDGRLPIVRPRGQFRMVRARLGIVDGVVRIAHVLRVRHLRIGHGAVRPAARCDEALAVVTRPEVVLDSDIRRAVDPHADAAVVD